MAINFRGGRLPAKHTLRTQRLAVAVSKALAPLGAPPVESNDYVSAVMKQSPNGWGMFMNGPDPNAPAGVPENGLGDCVCADSAHQCMLHTANSGTIVIPTEQDCLSLYEAVGGYVLGDADTDGGCNETDMCQYLIKTGIAGIKTLMTAPVDPTNADHLKWGTQLFGAVRLGITVTDDMMNAFNAGQAWTAYTGSPLGGHDVPMVGYDSAYAHVLTWGQIQPVSWGMLVSPEFSQEAHVEAWPNFLPKGYDFDMAALLAEAQQIEATSSFFLSGRP